MNRPLKITIFICIALLILVALKKIHFGADWRTANRSSANIAPKPEEYKDAVVQIYSARTFSWRGLFAVHTWIATKSKNADYYTVYQIVGWRQFWKLPVLSIEQDIPDRYWFNQPPTILKSFYGQPAAELIPKIETAAESYPYKGQYIVWPGPNSNTFTAYIARKVPELNLALPPIAIGKDFLGNHTFFAKAPSNTGFQFSLFGVFGILLAREEGLEINIIGLVIGINPLKLAIALPCIGELAG